MSDELDPEDPEFHTVDPCYWTQPSGWLHGYRYTKARRPIFAMYSGPGPKYALPTLLGKKERDPQSVFLAAPSYYLGMTLSRKFHTAGPGAGKYLPDPKVLKNGREHSPDWTMCPRRRLLPPFSTPGPPRYEVEKVTSTFWHAPQYSMGHALVEHPPPTYPGPGKYDVPSVDILAGYIKAPAYSLSCRHEKYKPFLTPCGYDISKYQDKAPAYSMGVKLNFRGRPVNVGFHDTVDTYKYKHAKPPQHHFGMHHSFFKLPCITAGDVDIDDC